MSRTIYFGPPGTGKTTTLLTRLEEHLRQGVPVDEIAFLTFTRRARREAVERVGQVLGIKPKDLAHFRTIHSMAFRALKLRDDDVMGRPQLTEFGLAMGVEFGNVSATEQAAEGISSQSKGDHLLAIDNLARLRGCEAKQVWQQATSPYEWPEVDQFLRSYNDFKKERALLDYTDILLEYSDHGPELDVQVAFIDEAQDLSSLQWAVALGAVAKAHTQYIAGDDDQAIYRWAGAEVESFMQLTGERIVLDHSFRLPRSIHARAGKILNRIKHRVPKEFAPREADGAITRHASATSIRIEKDEQWLWLVRNRYAMQPLRELLAARGVVYSQHGASSIVESERDAIYAWERLRLGKALPVPVIRDMYSKLRSGTQIARGHKLLPKVDESAELTLAQLRESSGLLVDGPWFDVFNSIPLVRRSYYRQILREHGTLKVAPQVQLETIHGAKGAEAQKVALFLEQSRRTWEEGQKTPDEEHRVWYVGATRAREELHIVEGQSRFAYQFPA